MKKIIFLFLLFSFNSRALTWNPEAKNRRFVETREKELEFLYNFGGGKKAIEEYRKAALKDLEFQKHFSDGDDQDNGIDEDHDYTIVKPKRRSKKQINNIADKYIKLNKKAVAKEKKNCKAVDLRGPKFGPVRNQGSIGWCYAFSAADLLSYKMGKKISASSIALDFNKKFKKKIKTDFFNTSGKEKINLESNMEGGHPFLALKNSILNGLCLESEVSSENEGEADLRILLNITEKQKINYKKTEQINCSIARQIFPKLNNLDIINAIQTSEDHNYLQNLVNKSCDKIKPKGITAHSAELFWGKIKNPKKALLRSKKIFKSIDKQLDANNPLSINYNSDILYTDPASTGQRLFTANHASLIVGRKWNKERKECDYLIRNSYGRSCKPYHKNHKCEKGNIWVSKRMLSGTITSVVHIK